MTGQGQSINPYFQRSTQNHFSTVDLNEQKRVREVYWEGFNFVQLHCWQALNVINGELSTAASKIWAPKDQQINCHYRPFPKTRSEDSF